MREFNCQINTENRLGMTLDVINVIASLGIDISTMEVQPNYIFIKLLLFPKHTVQAMIYSLQQIPGVNKIEQIDSLPYEEKENQMKTILYTVSEGILSIDQDMNIRMINDAAQKIFDVHARDVINKKINLLWGNATELEKRLDEGIEILYERIELKSKKGSKHTFICSYHPITNEQSKSSGMVVILRHQEQIIDLMHSIQKSMKITFDDIVGDSKLLAHSIDTSKKVAKSDASILLHGESGTGKELFARSIHNESDRRRLPFVPINCAAIPEALLESELFGYEEGAFTGAKKGGKQGLFQLANKGTLFLDEIGEIPLHVQAKLLRALEEKVIRPVGGTHEMVVDVRIISATNRDLPALIKERKFRDDLYYRLNVIPIRIPSIRERTEDIPVLVHYFIKKLGERSGKSTLRIHPTAMQALTEYIWPGNVRELQNVIERAIYFTQENTIKKEHLFIPSREKLLFTQMDQTMESALNLSESSGLKEKVEAYEKQLLIEALAKYKTVRKTAKQMKLSHTAVLNKVKKYGISLDNI